jgi:cytochrome d ubiquinol oxidase subunit II
MAAAAVAGIVAFAGIFVLHSDARYVYDGLTSRALPLVILSAVCGLGSLALLARGADRVARIAAGGAVASVVVAWGVAQWPYLLPTTLTVSRGAAPSASLTALLIICGIGAVTVLPSLLLLYVLDQRSMLQTEDASASS